MTAPRIMLSLAVRVFEDHLVSAAAAAAAGNALVYHLHPAVTGKEKAEQLQAKKKPKFESSVKAE